MSDDAHPPISTPLTILSVTGERRPGTPLSSVCVAVCLMPMAVMGAVSIVWIASLLVLEMVAASAALIGGRWTGLLQGALHAGSIREVVIGLWCVHCLMNVRAIIKRRCLPDTYWSTVLCLAGGCLLAVIYPPFTISGDHLGPSASQVIATFTGVFILGGLLLWFGLGRESRRHYGVKPA